MVNVRKCILIAAVLILQSSLYSMDLVYQYVEGSLSDSWRINFTIITDQIDGVILYSFDSLKNQFGMEVKRSGGNLKRIRITYNKMCTSVPVKESYHSGSTKFRKVWFNIELGSGSIKAESNIFDQRSFPISSGTKRCTDNTHVFPKNMTNTEGRIYFTMGNIGPYLGEHCVTVNADKEEMNGCVESLLYKDKRIELMQSGVKMLPSCPCNDKVCNGGLCHQQSNFRMICDCSKTALNGPYCNRSLIKYDPGSRNSYEILKNVKEIHFKISWKQLLIKRYPLLEISTLNRHAAIYIDESHLMLNNTFISDTHVQGINFADIVIDNKYLRVKINKTESKIYFPINKHLRINVGFSERNASCEVFDGAYELHFNSSQLRKVDNLKDNGTKIQSWCQWRCRDGICNGGICQELSNHTMICDCSSTALNGMYCNESLKIYNPGSHNTYEVVEEAKKIHFKMTWRQLQYKVYCLIDISTRNVTFTIYFNKSHLMINGFIISNVSADGINFINVILAHNTLIVKSNDKTSTSEGSFNENIRINVGFSEKNGTCETFEGTYDFFSNYSQLVPLTTQKQVESVTKYATEKANHSDHDRKFNTKDSSSLIVIFVGLAVTITFIVLSVYVGNVLMTLKKKTNGLTGNVYEGQPLVPFIPNVTPSSNIEPDSDPYDYVDHVNTNNNNENTDGYIHLKLQQYEDIPPEPLPRN